MKRAKTSPQTDFEKLYVLLEKKSTSLEKQIKDLDHNQKISNQKNDDSFRELRVRIFTESRSTREELERSFRAEIQVANKELEKSLSQRITYIADLITIQLGNKLQNHEKRIKKLEQIPHAA